MGAWDASHFGNDAACDWGAELATHDDFSYVEAALDRALAESPSIPTNVGCHGLAAAEVIARCLGNWGVRDEDTEDADLWVERTRLTPSAALIQKALRVVESIAEAPSSLAQLWADSEEWLAEIADLRRRLGASD